MRKNVLPTCSYDPLQLIGLDPNELVDALVTPQLETLPPKLHGAPGHPQEDQTLVLKVVTTILILALAKLAINAVRINIITTVVHL